MSEVSPELKEQILKWFCDGEKGLSSKAMARCAVGNEPISRDDRFTPLDPDDLNRCIKLVHACPDIKSRFPAIATLSDKWRVVIERWDLLEETFISEVGYDWCNAKSAPKTYDLMHKLGL